MYDETIKFLFAELPGWVLIQIVVMNVVISASATIPAEIVTAQSAKGLPVSSGSLSVRS